MKTEQYNNVVMVEVSANLIDVVKLEGNNIYYGNDRGGFFYRVLPSGQYTIIGKGDELTDMDWEGIVEYDLKELEEDKYWYHYVKEGVKANLFFDSPTKSGHSLLASKGFSPSTTLIIKKISST